MIECKDGWFHLRSDAFSYLLRVNAHGLLEQVHFGPCVSTADGEALRCRPGLGWGGSLLLDDADRASCPDALTLAWSGSGRGDFRESPMELGEASDLRYTGYRIVPGGVPMKSVLPQAHGAAETLAITMEQPGARLTLYFSLFSNAITRRAVLENTGAAPFALHKLMSFCLDLPGDYAMTTFDGGWIAEAARHTVPVSRSRVVNESVTGFSSHRHNPGFLLSEPDATEETGRVYGFNLIYSGNHYASAQQSLQGLTRVMQGVSPSNFSLTLAPGESFETPEAVLCCSSGGFGGLSRRMHRFISGHILPAYWSRRARPVLYNSWEGCTFDFTQQRLLDLARRAKDLGCELFVLDDGWFAGRDDDRAGLGDYQVNLKKLPQGLEGLSQRIQALGLQFGLWFEPESVNENSDLYRAHPDWALTDGFTPILGRHQLLLDLTKQAVRDYIVENVSRIIDRAGIRYVKWDMNRHSVALGAKAHAYILGLYDVLRRIFGPRPRVLLESCSSGGNRFDLGMLCFSPQIWCSDNTDPVARLEIQEGLSYLYPQSCFGAHVSASPHGQTLRTTPLATRANVAFFGCLGYELDLRQLLAVEVKDIQAQISFYKRHRGLFQFGRFYRLKNGWQVCLDGKAAAGVFHRMAPSAPGYEQLRLRELDPQKRYVVRARPQKLRVGQFGGLVRHVSPVPLDPNGLVLRVADRRVMLGDAAEVYHVTGAALSAGIQLAPLFRGTGYDPDQRTQADYGSNVYIIEEEAI